MASQTSNKTTYWVIGGILLIVILAYGGYRIRHHFMKGQAMQYANVPTPQNSSISQPSAQGSQTAGHMGSSNNSSTNDLQLQQDEQSIENSMNQLDQDQSTSGQDTNNASLDIPQEQ